MELKVWVDGLQRIVCGVNDATTCQDVVYALAHATGQTGRFTLIEKWRSNERALAPQDRPLKVLTKWGNYAPDVHLILRRSHQQGPLSPVVSPKNKEALPKKSQDDGPVKNSQSVKVDFLATPPSSHKEEMGSMSGGGSNYLPVGRMSQSPVRQTGVTKRQMSPGKVLSGTLSPPPYRSPPTIQRTIVNDKIKRSHGPVTSNGHLRNFPSSGETERPEVQVVYDARYKDLVRLVNMQRETLTKQHTQLTQFDAEIGFWEEKHKDLLRKTDVLESESRRLDLSEQELCEEEAGLNQQHIDEELELTQKQERKLNTDLAMIRAKFAKCEAELVQCKNRTRQLMDEMAEEQHLVSHAQVERERNLLNDIEDLRRKISDKLREYESKVIPLDTLAADVAHVESSIAHKKKEIDALIEEIKAANLQSLTIAPTDDSKHSEGITQNRPGSTRKIVGSPRQLENAVPTNKNPHGVWV
uniref:Ras-associating domain-containing protein n=1 Tax=Strigamia maritima TaxID=126957 RepID=T1IQR8_STRMM